MNPDHPELLDLAARVSDGSAIDWAAAERGAEARAEPRIVRHLKLVERLSRVHREALSGEALGDSQSLASTVSVLLGLERTPPGAPEPPMRWGRLELREALGRGGFGTVYRAWDETLQQDVALKLLDVRGDDPRRVEALLSEARALARVRHSNVVSVHSAEIHDGRLGIWMELVRGETLARVIEGRGRFGAHEATLIGLELCRALSAVHAAGLVHGDVKPANVMRAEGGRILLMDFGATSKRPEPGIELERRLSGTPLYMAPEVLSSASASVRSDLYSLGVLLYQLVTGRLPVEARSLDELRGKHERGQALALRDARSDLPEPFVRVIERALVRDPAARYVSAGEMEQALAATLGMEAQPDSRPTPPPSPIPRWVIAAIAVVLLGGLLAGAGWLSSRWRAATAGDYEIAASLHRLARGAAEPSTIDSGAKLALDDQLTLEIRASAPLYVYVFNEDERGHAYALFPLPGLDLQNPLPAGSHVLPGPVAGRDQAWIVTTAGGRERMAILASPEPQASFEAQLARLPRPEPGQLAVQLSGDAVRVLRGIGGLEARRPPAGNASAQPLFAMAERLAGGTERARGVWLRQIELDNPGP